MRMIAKLSCLLCVIGLVTSAVTYYMFTGDQGFIVGQKQDDDGDVAWFNLSSVLVVEQDAMNLNHEVVQYRIVFHDDTMVNISVFMALQQTGEDYEQMCSFIMLTDGNRSVFGDEYQYFFINDVPSGSIVDLNVFGNRICIGGKIFCKVLQRTRFRIGSSVTHNEDVKALNNSVWYLTVAQLDNMHEEMLSVSLKATGECMEVQQIHRGDKMGFYTSVNNDFEGRYFGFRLPLLPFGFSIARNLHKQITTTEGSVFIFSSIGHMFGRLTVAYDGDSYADDTRKHILLSHMGNMTGVFDFSASGIGFPWKHIVYLFYMDVNPYIV